MTQKSIADLDESTNLDQNDVFIVITDPTGLNDTNKITANNVFKGVRYLRANVFSIALKTTPANSTTLPSGVSSNGSIWFDDNYVYVVTSSGTIKRATLNTF